MAGTSTPALAAAVSNAGGLGNLGLGAMGPEAAAEAMADTAARTARPYGVNLFCHRQAPLDADVAEGWINRARPLFADFGAEPPARLTPLYPSFVRNDAMLRAVLAARPAFVSFHFGLPDRDQIRALKQAGITLAATATSLAEAQAVARAGLDAVVTQGWQAGGHRGLFDPDGPDERLETATLVRLLVRKGLPVIAAGGIMDGRDGAAMLAAGAVAVQMGTAFVACPESAADAAYRARLTQGGTVMTRAISGRPARCLTNRFTTWAEGATDAEVPAYPYAYDLGKALNAAARAAGETGFGAQWAGTGAERARAMPAAELVATLARELHGTATAPAQRRG